MKRSLFLVLLLFVFFATDAYADEPIFNITGGSIDVEPLEGGRAVGGWSLTGPGTRLQGFADLGCSWCSVGTSFAPGQLLNPSIDFIDFISFGSEIVGFLGGETSHDLQLSSARIGAGSFTFPSEGTQPSIFTVTVPASLGDPNGPNGEGRIVGISSDRPFGFFLNIAPGNLMLTFDLLSASGGEAAAFIFSEGTFTVGREPSTAVVPEPSTFSLLTAGLAGIAGVIRGMRIRRQRRTR